MSSFDNDLRLALRAIDRGAADISVEVTRYQLPAGVIMATKVVLYKVTDLVFDEVEVTYYVVRCGNPDQVVLKTEDADEATAAYVAECHRADEERRIWLEDHAAARR